MAETTPIDLETVVRCVSEIVTAPIEDELVMLNLEQGMYYGLDDIATYIWNHLQEPRKVADLCGHLMEEFDVDRETCQRETLELLNSLYGQHLLKIDEKADS